MNFNVKIFVIAVSLLSIVPPLRADVTVPSIFSDHLVLQCGVPAPIWGRADPGEKVTVTFADHHEQTVTDHTGRWIVKLGGLVAGTAGPLTLEGRNRLVIQDVLVGEVWLAAGQSNMQLRVSEAENTAAAIASADLPRIRMFTVAQRPAVSAADECAGQWVVCQPDTVGRFSAAAFYFARELHATLAVPIGVINASWGATPIEAWTSPSAMAGHLELTPIFAAWDDKNREPQPADATPLHASKNYPGNLFNGMIAPLIPFALRGVIWYQGENNANSGHPELYALQLPVLIEDWRHRWGQGPLPFAWVQLPNFQPKNLAPDAPAKWPVVREAMLHALSIPNTGMAVTIDLGEAGNIHPRKKTEVGHRLALWARARVYGESIPYSGPLPAGFKINGREIIVSFEYTERGLVARDGALRGFFIAGADRQWVPAEARVTGDRIVLMHPAVTSPRQIRYAWADNPEANLFNGAGLPASPFRTDDWTP